jgi:maleate isomerase
MTAISTDALPERPEYGAVTTIGIAVPQANPTVEPEFWTLVPHDVAVLTTRLSGSRVDSKQRLIDYIDNFQGSLDAYDTAKLDAVGFACTGSSYLIGAEDEARRIDAFSEKCGYPIITAAQSIRSALQSLGAERIALFAPYPEWLVDACRAYWTRCGLELTGFTTVAKDISDTRNVYGVGFSDVMNSVARLQTDQADVILMTGTGVPTLRAILALSEQTGKPVLSSNLCLAWSLLRTAGAGIPIADANETLIGGWRSRLQR